MNRSLRLVTQATAASTVPELNILKPAMIPTMDLGNEHPLSAGMPATTVYLGVVIAVDTIDHYHSAPVWPSSPALLLNQRRCRYLRPLNFSLVPSSRRVSLLKPRDKREVALVIL